MEKQLLAISLASRQDFELVKSYIDLKSTTYSKEFQVLLGKAEEYYARDSAADHVLPEVLVAQMAESVRSDKMLQRLSDFVSESVTAVGSISNVRAVVMLAKQQEVADKLAAALVSDVGAAKVDSLMEQLAQLRKAEVLEEQDNSNIEVFQGIDLAALMDREYDPANLIKVYPLAVNERLDGGAHPGHHLVVFARPETGKSAFVINASCGFAYQRKRVLYVINEDRPQDIILRHISNLSGMNKHEVRDNPPKAQELALSRGWDHVIVASAAPGSPDDIRRLIDKYDPAVVIGDQLRNFKVRAENRTNQLEIAATEMRNIGKEANVLVMSVTQAGDSASNKLVLEQGDVDGSNTGIPAQADVMIGIGVDATTEAEGVRVISLPKNKIGGVHDSFPVRINTPLSRYSNV